MEFLHAVSQHVTNQAHVAAAYDWWNALAQSHTPLRQNIDQDQLFDSSLEASSHLREFTEGLANLSDNPTDPVTQAKEVINNTGKMVCAGPLNTQALNGSLCHLKSSLIVYRYLTNDASRTALPTALSGGYNATALAAWACDLSETYRQKLAADEFIRGQLPNAFWTLDEDFYSLDGPTCNRMRAFLGLEPVSPEEIQIVFFLSVADVSHKWVPTGWDAFDNPHFLPQRGGATFGQTKDLHTGGDGARELVTRPIPIHQIQNVQGLGGRP